MGGTDMTSGRGQARRWVTSARASAIASAIASAMASAIAAARASAVTSAVVAAATVLLMTGPAQATTLDEGLPLDMPAPRFTPPPAPPAPLPLPPPPGQAESLPALLARVLPVDPQVRVATALRAATEERRLQARSRLAPVVGVSATRGTSRDIEFGRPLEREIDRAEATLRWNLYNAGNDAAELSGATRDLRAADHELRRAREEVAELIAEAYNELLRTEGQVPLAAERLQAVQRLTAQVQRQFDAGRVSDADLQQAQTSQLDAEITLSQVQSDRDSARLRLATLVGGEVRPPMALAVPAAPDAASVPQPGVLAAARERAAAARQRVRPQVSLLAPRIDLELRRRLSDRTTPQSTTEVQSGWVVTARWDFPVGGESLWRRNETELRAQAAEAEADRILRGIESELQALGPRVLQAESSIRQIDLQLARYDALLRAGELQFEAGRRTLAQLVALHESRYVARARRTDQFARLLGSRLRELTLRGELLGALGVPGTTQAAGIQALAER